MYFGLEFFDYYCDIFKLEIIENIEIPENLFELGLLPVFEPENNNYNNSENFYLDFDQLNNLNYFFPVEPQNYFVCNFDEFLKNFRLLQIGFDGFFQPRYFFDTDSGGLPSGLTKLYDDRAAEFFQDRNVFETARYFTENLIGNTAFEQIFGGAFDKIFEFFEFPEAYIREPDRFFEIPRTRYGGLEKTLDFSDIFSEIFSEKYTGISKNFQDPIPELARGPDIIKPDNFTEKYSAELQNIITPRNIFSAAADGGSIRITEKSRQEKLAADTLQSSLNRRVKTLEEIVRGRKISAGADCGEVLRRLELELRSALNSCSEGVHF